MFDETVKKVVDLEGSYSNDQNDPGGETNHGVTLNTLREAKKRSILDPTVTINNLTIEQAEKIYKVMYWDACRCDELPEPLNAYVFDAAVNQGVNSAIMMLQRALKLSIDGIIGPLTINAIKIYKDQKELSALFMAERIIRYTQTSNFDRYGKGWVKRCFSMVMDFNK